MNEDPGELQIFSRKLRCIQPLKVHPSNPARRLSIMAWPTYTRLTTSAFGNAP